MSQTTSLRSYKRCEHHYATATTSITSSLNKDASAELHMVTVCCMLQGDSPLYGNNSWRAASSGSCLRPRCFLFSAASAACSSCCSVFCTTVPSPPASIEATCAAACDVSKKRPQQCASEAQEVSSLNSYATCGKQCQYY
jgi:hypothetical protein